MLRPEDLRIEIYLTAAGESERIVHEPTQIERFCAGRMNQEANNKLLAEIEGEIRGRGFMQQILPDPMRRNVNNT